MVSSTTTSSPAPWRNLFLEHIGTMKSPEFVLSTVRRIPATSPAARYGSSSSSNGREGSGGGASSSTALVVPRARTCIFRGMWAGLDPNPKNDARLNPDAYESELLTFTTDARMDKMAELFDGETSEGEEVLRGGGGDGKEDEGTGRYDGTGGGGPVEAVFWATEPMTQWRVRGRAYVLAPDVESGSESSEAVRKVVRERMRRREGKADQDAEEEEGWSFGRELTAHFGNLSPGMRGTFKNPPPGRPIGLPVGDQRLGLGQKVTGLDDEVARANFRVVVIVPFEVDRCDLSDPARGRRWVYRFAGDGGNEEKGSEPVYPGGEIVDGWEKVETWP